MKMNWLACAAATVCLAAPAMSQTDSNVVITGSSAGMAKYTNVDMTEVRGTMDELRGYLERMQHNNKLAFSVSDAVHLDTYRRMNVILLDNATGFAMETADALGPFAKIPPGLGAARNHIASVVNHLAHARMMADYSTPIDQAKTALDHAYESLDRSNMAMSGYSTSGMGMSGTMSTGTTDMGTNMN